MKFRFIYFPILISFYFLSCSNNDDQSNHPSQTLTFTFDEGTEGWEAGFSDYPADWEQERFEFDFAHSELPESVSQNGKSLMITGRNLSDDLFMFIKREFKDLKPSHTYQLRVQIELASQYPEQSVGIGGSPGSSVYLKAGGSAIEPLPVTVDGEKVMNIDKGNQSQGGADMLVLSTIGIPGNDFTYQIIRRNNLNQPLNVNSDASGNLWVIIGTDSGFEGTTTLYYNAIEVRLQE
ncbi:hypothetical protein BH23BAC1_BH23BAC1_06580 [soil metagenome]